MARRMIRIARRGGIGPRGRSASVRPLLVWALAALAVPTGAGAAVLKLPDAPYSYTVIDQDLAAALQEFGANLGIKVNVSPEVKGRIQGRIPEGKARAFLDRLTTNYNLEWYFDGSVLYVTSAKENRTQLLVLSPISFDTLKGALDALQISDSRFPVRPSPGQGVVMVSGPPRYVALIEQTLAGLVAEEQAKPRSPAFAGKGAAPGKVTVLTVFRGASTTILRDGQPERVAGPDYESAPQPESPAAGQPRAGLGVSAPGIGVPGPGAGQPGAAAPAQQGAAPAPLRR